eukprot:Hpha_TRINITY_DN16865_c0_g1::TRINITY_DN16865_c0_g1_i1::g.150916::m.150916
MRGGSKVSSRTLHSHRALLPRSCCNTWMENTPRFGLVSVDHKITLHLPLRTKEGGGKVRVAQVHHRDCWRFVSSLPAQQAGKNTLGEGTDLEDNAPGSGITAGGKCIEHEEVQHTGGAEQFAGVLGCVGVGGGLHLQRRGAEGVAEGGFLQIVGRRHGAVGLVLEGHTLGAAVARHGAVVPRHHPLRHLPRRPLPRRHVRRLACVRQLVRLLPQGTGDSHTGGHPAPQGRRSAALDRGHDSLSLRLTGRDREGPRTLVRVETGDLHLHRPLEGLNNGSVPALGGIRLHPRRGEVQPRGNLVADHLLAPAGVLLEGKRLVDGVEQRRGEVRLLHQRLLRRGVLQDCHLHELSRHLSDRAHRLRRSRPAREVPSHIETLTEVTVVVVGNDHGGGAEELRLSGVLCGLVVWRHLGGPSRTEIELSYDVSDRDGVVQHRLDALLHVPTPQEGPACNRFGVIAIDVRVRLFRPQGVTAHPSFGRAGTAGLDTGIDRCFDLQVAEGGDAQFPEAARD